MRPPCKYIGEARRSAGSKIYGCLSDCRWHGRAGTVDTADGEARDITSFVSGSAARDEANKDVARTESLLQLPSKPTLTKLSMAGGEDAAFFVRGAGEADGVCAVGADIATLNDIHAAYIRGSVPTAAQESDDILNQPFSD